MKKTTSMVWHSICALLVLLVLPAYYGSLFAQEKSGKRKSWKKFITSGKVDYLIDLRLGAPNPLVTSPSIDWDLDVNLDFDSGSSSLPNDVFVEYLGKRDGFPAHDVFINDTLIDTHDPRVTGEGLHSLFPPMESASFKEKTINLD